MGITATKSHAVLAFAVLVAGLAGSESGAAPSDPGKNLSDLALRSIDHMADANLRVFDDLAAHPIPDLDRPNAPIAGPEIEGTTDSGIILAFSEGATNSTVRLIGEVERVCRSVSAEYRISCLGEGFKWVAKTMPNRPDYRAARSAISKAGSRLQAIAKQNRDRAAPVGTTTQGREWKTRKKFTPVEKSKLRSANAAATAAIQETETRLLRAGENSEKRRVHYQRIAAAMGSTKRILRS